MADDSSDFVRSMGIATSGLRAQAGRMRVISENIANADSTAPTAGGDPYRRKVPTFTSELDRTLDAKVVALGKVRPDSSAFRVKHEPSNPAADIAGNVKYPNVNPLIEMTDMRCKCLRQPCPHPGHRRRRKRFRSGRAVVRSGTQGRDRKRAGGGKKSD